MRCSHWIFLVGLVSLLTACGGGGGGGDAAPGATPAPGGGTTPAPAAPGAAATPDTYLAAFKISRFGSGTIVDASGKTVCDQPSCQQLVTPGQSFSLTPQAPAGWAFHHWAGCDQVTGQTCQVTVGADRTVHPYFTRTSGYKVKPDVEVLDAFNAFSLVKREGSMLIFANRAWRPPQLPVGRIIISQAGEGFARRVLSVKALPGGNTYVDTADVSLEDILAEGTFIVTAADIQRAGGAVGDRKKALATASASLSVVDGKGDGMVGTLAVTVDTEFALDVSLTEGVREFKLILSPQVKPEVEFRLAENLIDLPFKPIFLRTFTPIILGPLVLVPEIDVGMSFKADMSEGVKFGGFYEGKGIVGRHFVKGFGTQEVGEYTSSAKFSLLSGLSVQAKGEATAALSAKGKLRIYGSPVGPYVAAVGDVTVSLTDTVSQEASCPFRLSTAWSAGLDAGGEAKVLGAKVEFVASIRPLGGKIFDDIDPFKCEDTQAPTKPGNLVLVATSPTSMSLSWLRSTDNGKSITYRIRRLIPTVAETKGTSYADIGLQADTEYCYVVVAVDKKGNLSEPSNTACLRTPKSAEGSAYVPPSVEPTPVSSTAIRLSWPVDPARKATSYVIYQDNIEVGRTGGTTFDALKLLRGKQYCFRVASLTPGGQSPLSAPICANTLNSAAWTMSIKCDVQAAYVVTNELDLDLQSTSQVSVAGDGTDYNGGALAYILTGTYDPAKQTLDGKINWGFAQSADVREDVFLVNVAGKDTGDVTMTQTRVTGCTTQIRFQRRN